MNASDVINAVGASPGVITTLTGTLPLTYTYTASSQTVELQLVGSIVNTVLQVNGVSVASISATGVSQSFDVRFPVAKGQSVAITIPSSSGSTGGFMVLARSIR